MRPSIIFATAEYVKRLREECLRENKPLHRHTRFRRQELAQDEINPDVLAMSGHIARRCSEQKRVRIPAMRSANGATCSARLKLSGSATD